MAESLARDDRRGSLMQLISKVKNGVLALDSDEYRKFLLKKEGRDILVSLDEFGEDKTKAQLGYLFGGIVGALEDLGWSKKDAEIYLKQHCGECEQFVDPKTGEIKLLLPSIADMDKKELSIFIDECVRHLGEQGVEVPTPQDYWASKRVKQ